MRKYIASITIITLMGSLIYLSSIYLAKAEYSFKQLSQETEETEKNNQEKINMPVQNPPTQEQPKQEIQPIPVEPAKIAVFPAPEVKPAVPQPKPIEMPTQETKATEPTEPPTISMDFVNANLKDVLKIFCQQSKLNFIAGENVELKPITLYLNNVSIQDALNSIIKANGLTYERAEGSDVFIVRKTAEPELKLETRIFKLNYASAEDQTITGIDNQSKNIKGIKEVVQKLLTPNGDLSVDIRTNSLIITDIPSRFALIEKSVKNLDSELAQVLIEAKVVEIGSNDLTQLGIKWSSLAEYNIGIKSPTRSLNDSRKKGRDINDKYGYETEDTLLKEDELVQHPYEGTTSETITTTNTLGNSLTRALTDTLTNTVAKSDIRSAILSADDFTVALSLLLTNEDVDVISSPNIVTMNGKEAKITIGEKYPIPQYSYNTDTSTWEVQGFDYKDIGVLLRVIPNAVQEENNVSLDIHPEVSSISGYVNFGGAGGAKIPIIATREATTNVAIRDGDTLAIGGLLTTKDDTTITKVPLLGDLPLLGNLFRHKEAGKQKTNLVIFITPHILKDGRIPPGAISEATVQIPIANAPVQPEIAAPEPAQTKQAKTQSTKKEGSNFNHR
jgi:type IV pilus assembly protein PilQ